MGIDGSWLFAAVLFALFLVVVVATALLEALLRRVVGPDPAEQPRVTGTLPVIDGCRSCLLAREAGQRALYRHLAVEHGYLVMGTPSPHDLGPADVPGVAGPRLTHPPL
jgi:hypothetical protein